MDCWKLGEYAREAPLYACPVITSSLCIQYLTTAKNCIQARWILPSLKKCLRGLKAASTNKGICADVGTCVVYCGQWACPKKPNGSLTESDATDNALIYEWFHLGWKEEISVMLKSAGILAPPAMEAGSHLVLPDSQDSSTPWHIRVPPGDCLNIRHEMTQRFPEHRGL